MGFASWNPEHTKIDLKIIDEFLWKVPDFWSLEDASTVTFTYTVVLIYQLLLT